MIDLFVSYAHDRGFGNAVLRNLLRAPRSWTDTQQIKQMLEQADPYPQQVTVLFWHVLDGTDGG